MSSNAPYPPSNNPPYPTQQQMNQYPPPSYGMAYPPSSNQPGYPPPVETVPSSNPAFPPPPTYDAAVGSGPAPGPYDQNFSYQTPIPPGAAPATYPPSSYKDTTYDVEYQGQSGSYDGLIISFDDKTIRLGKFQC